MEPSVLVVGAGPAGLTMAADLLRRGIACRIVDSAEKPSDRSRAVAVHSRTLESLEPLGASADLVARGVAVHDMNVWVDGRRTIRVGFDELETPFPFVLCLPQNETEAALHARLVALGGRVERATSLVALEDRGGAMRATLRAARDEVVEVEWVVGCDGSHSAVRHALGIAFEGAPYEEKFILADVRVAWDLPLDELHAFLTESGPMLVAPLGQGRSRIVAALPPDATEVGAEPSLDEVRAALRRGREGADVGDPRWTARFRIHHRLAATYRKGRAFLAGDAAHIHSPVGGQGMNTGIQDALNLAWKLALVVRGAAPPELLDTYEIERRPIAQAVVRATDVATRVATLRNPIARALRNHLGALLASLEPIQHRITRAAAGLAFDYSRSPIVGERRPSAFAARLAPDPSSEEPSATDVRDFAHALAPGHRAVDVEIRRRGQDRPERLLDLLGGSHALFLFDGRAATEEGWRKLERIGREVERRFGDEVRAHVVTPYARSPSGLRWEGSLVLDESFDLHRRYGAGAECLYLFRPDGYLGFRSQPAELEPLLEHLAKVLISR